MKRTGENAGMTDKRFTGFLRFLLDDLEEIHEEKKQAKLRKVIEHVRDTIED